ncbi:RNA recognition motif 2-domain-containing protein [Linnemannia elongata]|nr:RNA recognition motif 2-domain-containing protein [Linnemannia elongata]
MRSTSVNSNIGHAQRDVAIPLAPSDKRTTFMIRNIPNKYTQPMLLECINETHFGKFDFLYLRMDFKNKCNVGYAFINFINTEVVASFVQQHVGKKWGRFNSDKICSLSYATIQGRRALVDKFRNSIVMEEEPSYRPKVFYTSGPNLGLEESFPGPTLSKESARGHGPAHGPARRRVSSAPLHNEP